MSDTTIPHPPVPKMYEVMVREYRPNEGPPLYFTARGHTIVEALAQASEIAQREGIR